MKKWILMLCAGLLVVMMGCGPKDQATDANATGTEATAGTDANKPADPAATTAAPTDAAKPGDAAPTATPAAPKTDSGMEAPAGTK